LDIADAVAIFLREKSIDDVFKLASLFSGIPAAELHEKYANVNDGMRRMNLGNRIRHFVKEGGYKTVEAAISDAKAHGVERKTLKKTPRKSKKAA